MHGAQVGRGLRCSGVELGAEVCDGRGEAASACDEVCGNAGHDGSELADTPFGGVEVLASRQRAGWGVPCWVDLMEVPAQPVYAACALGYEVFSVIDQQPDLRG